LLESKLFNTLTIVKISLRLSAGVAIRSTPESRLWTRPTNLLTTIDPFGTAALAG
jgi:hypothetical protein